MTLDEWSDYINRCSGQRIEHMRYGQYAVSLLQELYPEIFKKISLSTVDPFYNDDKVPLFFAHLLVYYVNKTITKNVIFYRHSSQQKFQVGQYVYIDIKSEGMSHFDNHQFGYIAGSYYQRHPIGEDDGTHLDRYCVDIDGKGEHSWYGEKDLVAV